MGSLKRLIHEVHRRSLWQVLSIYGVGAWVVYQVILDLTEGLGLPEWVPPVSLVLFLVGLPVVLATAFVQEGISGAAEPTGHERREETPGPAGKPAIPDRSDGTRRLFTWRRALLGGVGAFALLGLAVAFYMAMRLLGFGPAATLFAKGELDERDRIVLADFGAPAGDSLAANMVTEALRVDLEQSPVVRLLEPRLVEAALGRMGHDPGTALDEELATELAVREGVGAVLTGELHAAGGSFLMSARLVSSEGGGALASFRATAADSSELVAAVDRLSGDIRSKIGESLRSVRESAPLERVTTASLEALEKYTQAVRLIAAEPESRRALALLEEAVALDSAFAMAHLRRAMLYGFLAGNPEGVERAREALSRAFEHRERLTPRERYLAEVQYHSFVTEDEEAARTAVERLVADYPDDFETLELLARQHEEEGEYARMAAVGRRILAADSTRALAVEPLLEALGYLGEWEELEGLLERHIRLFPADSLWNLHMRGYLAATRGEWEEAESLWTRLRRSGRGTAYEHRAIEELAELAMLRGKLEEATALYLQAEETASVREAVLRVHRATFPMWIRAWFGLPADDELHRARTAVRRGLLDSLPETYLLEPQVAGRLAVGGDPALARGILEGFEQRGTPAELRRTEDDRWWARGWIALASGRPTEALEAFRRFREEEGGDCPLCGLGELARAHDAAGHADSARVYLVRFLETPDLYRMFADGLFRAPALERLGQLYDEEGDLEKAAEHYARFVELWAEADPELQARVRAAQRRLEEIVAERG